MGLRSGFEMQFELSVVFEKSRFEKNEVLLYILCRQRLRVAV